MRRWEFTLQERFEQDRMRLLDYREVNIEFKEWLINLLYSEVKETHESSEYSSDDDSLHDDRICDREQLGAVQSEIDDSGFDQEDDGRIEVSFGVIHEEERLAELIEEEPPLEFEEMPEDIYESFYQEVDAYKCQNKARTKKKHYKRK